MEPSKDYQWLYIAIAILFVVLTLIFVHFSANPVIVIVGLLIALLSWFNGILSVSLTDGIIEIGGSVLMVPFIAVVVDYVKKRRDEKVERIKTSRAALTKASTEDITWLTKVIGETTTHYASFNPKFEGIDEIPESPQILYHKNGLLKREYWDKNYKQGAAADLPALHLEKYYDYIDLYNQYYEAAILLTKGKTITEFEDLKKKPFLKKFEAFRKKYAELETVLFVYMSYFIGLFGMHNLSPLEIEYPRITRVLLYKLLDYGILNPRILNPEDYVCKKKYRYFGRLVFKSQKNEQDFENILERKLYFEEKSMTDIIAKKKLETENKDEGGEQEFQEWFINQFKTWEKALDEEIKTGKIKDFNKEMEDIFSKKYAKKIEDKKNDLNKKVKDTNNPEREFEEWYEKEFKNWKSMYNRKNSDWAKGKLFRNKIEEWLTADELHKILKDIYKKEKIQIFYNKVGKDYRSRFKQLLKTIKELKPLTTEEVEPPDEHKIMMKQHEIHKGLLDELAVLNTLKKENVITQTEFDKIKKIIIKKIKK